MDKAEGENKDDSPISGWTTGQMLVPFSEMRNPEGKTCLRIRTKRLFQNNASYVIISSRIITSNVYINPVFSSEVQINEVDSSLLHVYFITFFTYFIDIST